MDILSAAIILKYHNKWRRGDVNDPIHTPKEIGLAIDSLVEFTITCIEERELNGIKQDLNDKIWNNVMPLFPFEIKQITVENTSLNNFDVEEINWIDYDRDN